MNTSELMEKGHVRVLEAVDDLPEAQWDLPGACGSWSVKDTIAHLASYEQLLVTILTNVQEGKEPPKQVLQNLQHVETFNAQETAEHQYQTAQQVLNEYNDAQIQVSSLLTQLPVRLLEQKGTLPWYNANMSLAELLTSFSKHAEKHSEQIIEFRKQQQRTQSHNEASL